MNRLDAALAGLDDLLQEADDQTIDECLRRGAPPDWDPDAGDCVICGHFFHGQPCDPSDPWNDLEDCGCETSLTRLDDTWRPILPFSWQTWLTRRMAWTGDDGYAAQEEIGREQRADTLFRAIPPPDMPEEFWTSPSQVEARKNMLELWVQVTTEATPLAPLDLEAAGWTRVGLLDPDDGVTFAPATATTIEDGPIFTRGFVGNRVTFTGPGLHHVHMHADMVDARPTGERIDDAVQSAPVVDEQLAADLSVDWHGTMAGVRDSLDTEDSARWTPPSYHAQEPVAVDFNVPEPAPPLIRHVTSGMTVHWAPIAHAVEGVGEAFVEVRPTLSAFAATVMGLNVAMAEAFADELSSDAATWYPDDDEDGEP